MHGFTLTSLRLDGDAHVIAAALTMEISAPTLEQSGKARDASTATRLIARNLELSREEKAEARKIASEKRGALEAAKEARTQAAAAERKKRAEVDAVWGDDD